MYVCTEYTVVRLPHAQSGKSPDYQPTSVNQPLTIHTDGHLSGNDHYSIPLLCMYVCIDGVVVDCMYSGIPACTILVKGQGRRAEAARQAQGTVEYC